MSTSVTSRVAVIFGAGSNVGAALATGFRSAGYRVATVSRSGETTSPDDKGEKPFHIKADLSDPSAALGVLDKVRQSGWPFPSVIVWNAASLTPPDSSDPQNPFSIPSDGFDRDLRLQVKSPFLVAGEAVKAWRDDSAAQSGRRGTFIVTGNATPRRIFAPLLTTLGVGKSALNYWVGTADGALKEQGIREALLVSTSFFFADERSPEGGPVSKPNGDSHAKFYLNLAEGKEDLPYYVTFRNGRYERID
ncbi:hypothetical protein VPNG_06567 [Cytospora leucostoma]|uniref:NAD(P)-binding domain-containing protein n=1 Tax=Cytospora leucostoma TaxID=1230097 RepID=A0A423X2K6_9PEZI|nr:hypothetical protein VPNG_06567 [Cytospora leucostoma]